MPVINDKLKFTMRQLYFYISGNLFDKPDYIYAKKISDIE